MNHPFRKVGLTCLLALAITAPLITECSPSPQAVRTPTSKNTLEPSDEVFKPSPEPTIDSTPMQENTLTKNPVATTTGTPDLRLRPESWQVWPIIPDVSPEMLSVYKKGQAMGRDPHVFSVIGDCQSSPTYFLSLFDEGRYTLSKEQADLQETIDWYAGSFEHRSITVKNGLTAPGVLTPRWSDRELCDKTETPIACEIRINNPSLVLISLGTNWHPSSSPEEYLDYLTQIIDILLGNGIIPILSTKADNVEGDHSRNLAMAQIAYDYHLPLWNFWAAVKHLPNMGLDKDRSNKYLQSNGWDIRNSSALEVLDQVHRQLEQPQEQ